jgi:hypothetical protein
MMARVSPYICNGTGGIALSDTQQHHIWALRGSVVVHKSRSTPTFLFLIKLTAVGGGRVSERGAGGE